MKEGNPQIENGYTKIANELLEALSKAMAQRIITGEERAVVDWIIRYTYGFHEKNGYFHTSFIANNLGFSMSWVSQILESLKQKKVIIREGMELKINKHYLEWSKLSEENLEQSKQYLEQSKHLKEPKHLDLEQPKQDLEQSKQDLEEPKQVKPQQIQIESNVNEKKDDHKENYLKKTILKKTNTLCNTNSKTQIKVLSKPYTLSKWFYEFRKIPAQPTLMDMRNFKILLDFYSEEVIKKGIMWRLTHDSEGFWAKKITSASVYRNFGNWMAESSVKAISFTEWLTNNPNLDYRKFEDLMARADSFMRAFNKARRNSLVYFQDSDYEMYRKAIRIKTREAKSEIKGD